MAVLERSEGLSMADVCVFLLLLVLREGIALVLQLLRTHETVLGGFEADEAQLLLQLSGSELFEYRIGYAAPAGRQNSKTVLFWRRWWGDCGRGWGKRAVCHR